MIMLQTAPGIKENNRLNKMTVQTLILVTLVTMMVTTMPQTTQNKLTIHHRRYHSTMHEMARMTRMASTMRTAATMALMGMSPPDLVTYVMMRMVTSKKK